MESAKVPAGVLSCLHSREGTQTKHYQLQPHKRLCIYDLHQVKFSNVWLKNVLLPNEEKGDEAKDNFDDASKDFWIHYIK